MAGLKLAGSGVISELFTVLAWGTSPMPNIPSFMTDSDPVSASDSSGLPLLVRAWWQNRLKLVGVALGTLAVGALILVSVHFLSPGHREATLTFRLLFKGVEQGQYPNGMRFTPADIIAEPVLREVYQRKQSGLGGRSFDDFRTAFGVVPHNPALADFRRDFKPRLAAGGLSSVQRASLEDEYVSRRRALENVEYTLVMRLDGTVEDAGSLLEEVLAVWGEQSRSLGVFKFNRNVYSPNLLASLSSYDEDYLMLLDRLRITTDRILTNMEELGTIPGAALVRAGERGVSLGELELLMRDEVRYRMSLIEAQVYELGLYRSQVLSATYVSEQLVRLEREATEISSRAGAVERALATYSASRSRMGDGVAGAMDSGSGGNLMPQISEGFLDRVLGMANPEADIAFRQSLSRQVADFGRALANLESERRIYTRSQENLSKMESVSERARDRMDAAVERDIAQLIESLKRSLTELGLLHEEISRRDLEPDRIHSVIRPTSLRAVATTSPTRLGVVLFGTFAVVLGGTLVNLGWKAARPTFGSR